MAAEAPEWRLILGDGDGHLAPRPADGPTNMAVDRALLESVAGGATPALRLYRWLPSTLSFGRNQPTRGLYDEEAAAGRGVGFVRRPTGGQSVLHDDELTYALVAPVSALGKPRAAYRRINEALAYALGELGLEVEVAGPPGDAGERGPASWTEACFRRPERGEVVAGGRKLVGSAQRSESRTILQHGSILLGGTQAPAEELLLARPDNAPRSSAADARSEPGGSVEEQGWTTVASALGRRPAMGALVSALVKGFEVTLGITLARSTLTPRERAGRGELRDRFGSCEWTWRR